MAKNSPAVATEKVLLVLACVCPGRSGLVSSPWLRASTGLKADRTTGRKEAAGLTPGTRKPYPSMKQDRPCSVFLWRKLEREDPSGSVGRVKVQGTSSDPGKVNSGRMTLHLHGQ